MSRDSERRRQGASERDERAGGARRPGRGTLVDSRAARRSPGKTTLAGAVEPAAAARVRAEMERAYGTSFAAVRLVSDEHSAARASSLGVRAYADGNEIGFAHGAFDPDSAAGRHVIAHEFAHVVQARGGSSRGGAGAHAAALAAYHTRGTERTRAEGDANAAADRVVAGQTAGDVGAFALGVAGYDPHVDKGPPPRGTHYILDGGDSGFVFIFNSDDVLEWKDDRGTHAYKIYVADAFNADRATAETAAQTMRPEITSMQGSEAHNIKWGFLIRSDLHSQTKAYFDKLRPAQQAPRPQTGVHDNAEPGGGDAGDATDDGGRSNDIRNGGGNDNASANANNANANNANANNANANNANANANANAGNDNANAGNDNADGNNGHTTTNGANENVTAGGGHATTPGGQGTGTADAGNGAGSNGPGVPGGTAETTRTGSGAQTSASDQTTPNPPPAHAPPAPGTPQDGMANKPTPATDATNLTDEQRAELRSFAKFLQDNCSDFIDMGPDGISLWELYRAYLKDPDLFRGLPHIPAVVKDQKRYTTLAELERVLKVVKQSRDPRIGDHTGDVGNGRQPDAEHQGEKPPALGRSSGWNLIDRGTGAEFITFHPRGKIVFDQPRLERLVEGSTLSMQLFMTPDGANQRKDAPQNPAGDDHSDHQWINREPGRASFAWKLRPENPLPQAATLGANPIAQIADVVFKQIFKPDEAFGIRASMKLPKAGLFRLHVDSDSPYYIEPLELDSPPLTVVDEMIVGKQVFDDTWVGDGPDKPFTRGPDGELQLKPKAKAMTPADEVAEAEQHMRSVHAMLAARQLTEDEARTFLAIYEERKKIAADLVGKVEGNEQYFVRADFLSRENSTSTPLRLYMSAEPFMCEPGSSNGHYRVKLFDTTRGSGEIAIHPGEGSLADGKSAAGEYAAVTAMLAHFHAHNDYPDGKVRLAIILHEDGSTLERVVETTNAGKTVRNVLEKGAIVLAVSAMTLGDVPLALTVVTVLSTAVGVASVGMALAEQYATEQTIKVDSRLALNAMNLAATVIGVGGISSAFKNAGVVVRGLTYGTLVGLDAAQGVLLAAGVVGEVKRLEALYKVRIFEETDPDARKVIEDEMQRAIAQTIGGAAVNGMMIAVSAVHNVTEVGALTHKSFAVRSEHVAKVEALQKSGDTKPIRETLQRDNITDEERTYLQEALDAAAQNPVAPEQRQGAEQPRQTAANGPREDVAQAKAARDAQIEREGEARAAQPRGGDGHAAEAPEEHAATPAHGDDDNGGGGNGGGGARGPGEPGPIKPDRIIPVDEHTIVSTGRDGVRVQRLDPTQLTRSGQFRHPDGISKAEATALIEQLSFGNRDGRNPQAEKVRIIASLPDRLNPLQAETLQWMADGKTKVTLWDANYSQWTGDGILLGKPRENAVRTPFETLLHEGGHGHHLSVVEGVPGRQEQARTPAGDYGPSSLLQEINADFRTFGDLEKGFAATAAAYPKMIAGIQKRVPKFAELTTEQKVAFLENVVRLEGGNKTFEQISDVTVASALDQAINGRRANGGPPPSANGADGANGAVGNGGGTPAGATGGESARGGATAQSGAAVAAAPAFTLVPLVGNAQATMLIEAPFNRFAGLMSLVESGELGAVKLTDVVGDQGETVGAVHDLYAAGKLRAEKGAFSPDNTDGWAKKMRESGAGRDWLKLKPIGPS